MATKIKHLVIHCTATPEGREVTGKEIRAWHTSPPPAGRGWKQVGYTDLIRLDGSIERLVENNEDEFVDAGEITNGVAGINYCSRHVVYAGGVDAKMNPKDTRTAAQTETMRNYVVDFVKRFPFVSVAGHNQFDNKACPSFNVPEWLREIGVSSKNIYGAKPEPELPTIVEPEHSPEVDERDPEVVTGVEPIFESEPVVCPDTNEIETGEPEKTLPESVDENDGGNFLIRLLTVSIRKIFALLSRL